jgi:hypothetical protein
MTTVAPNDVPGLAKQALAASGEKGGLLLFLTGASEQQLRDVALAVAGQLDSSNPAAYMVDGRILGEHSWPFSRIRQGARIRLHAGGDARTETGGLIFPQGRPVVLLVVGMDSLSAPDQRAYSHLVDGEGGDLGLCPGSVVIAGIEDSQRVEEGARDRGMWFALGAA